MTQAERQKLKANSPYSNCAVLTRERFLFHEMRTTAKLHIQGLSDEEIAGRVEKENLFQYPTERMSRRMAGTCLKRLSCLEDEELIRAVAEAPAEDAKQICLYAMMRQYYLVWEFMVKAVGEKYRTLDMSFGKREVNAYFLRLQEQDDYIASLSDSTIKEVKKVLMSLLVENGYLDSNRSKQLNPVMPCRLLEEGILRNHDEKSFPAFNRFE